MISQRLLSSADKTFILPALEVMIGTATVRKLISEGRTRDLPQAMQNGEAGMQTLNQHLVRLVQSGLVAQEEALKNSDNPGALRRLLSGSYAGGDRQSIIGT